MGIIRSMTRHIDEVNRRKRYHEEHDSMIGYGGHRSRQRYDEEKSSDNNKSVSLFQRFKDKSKSVFTSDFNLRRSQKR